MEVKVRRKDRSIDTAITGTVGMRASLGELGSRSWYADKLDKCLHPKLKCYDDAKDYCNAHHDVEVVGVYLRWEKGQWVVVKIGKGFVKWLKAKGEAQCTRDNRAFNEPLETDVFIPCVSEDAALTLENALHKHFGKLEGVHKSIDSKIKIADPRWLKPGINSEGSKGKTEFFNFEDIWENRVDVFISAIKSLTTQSQINQIDFVKKARDPQVTGSELLCEWLLNGGSMLDFFLLMKPRAGKNTTMFWGIAKYVEILKKENPDVTLTIDFLSLWPSAFCGPIDDLKKYFYINGITLAGVNTYDENWQETYEELLNDPTVDVVFRFASLQSIDIESAKDYNSDEDREGAEINFVPAKSEYFKSNPGDLCIIDECDHGMRTTRSTAVLTAFGYTKRVWMSGSDLYALRSSLLFNPVPNHFLYDIFDEIKDVLAGKHHMSRMKKHSLIAKLLPGEELDPDTMDRQEITRKIVAMFKVAEKYGKLDEVIDRFVDEDGNILKFKYLSEVKRLWNMIYFWADNFNGATDTPSPEHLAQIFCSMPSIKACMAMYNHIKAGDIDCEHEVILANLFKSANRIEGQVNDRMKNKRTIFLTVGKMLRGAKAPWNCVMRFDRWNDFKVGLQLELRGQNTEDEYFHVYDANVFRSESMNYELVRSTQPNGKKINSAGKKLHGLIPMTRLGAFGEETVTWDDCVKSYQANDITEGYKRSSLIDRTSLDDDEFDKYFDKVSGIKGNKQPKDPREGKEGSTNKTASNNTPTGKEIDPLKDRIKKAIALSVKLPLLVYLTDSKYSEIDDLINKTDDALLEQWLGHCGVYFPEDVDQRSYIISIFEPEEINNQLLMTVRRFKNDDFDSQDIMQFVRAEHGDVPVKPELVGLIIDKMTRHLDWDAFPTFIDPSCGLGEFCVEWKNRLEQNGCTDADKRICFADQSAINIRITEKRLGFSNGIVYNELSELMEILEERNMIHFNGMGTNPPFQKPHAEGGNQPKNHNQWGKFVEELGFGDRIQIDVVGMITPDSWGSPANNIFQMFKDRNLSWVDTTVGRFFKEGSSFTAWVCSNEENNGSLTSIDGLDVDLNSLPYVQRQFVKNYNIHNKILGTGLPTLDFKSASTAHSGGTVKVGKVKVPKVMKEASVDYPYQCYHCNPADNRYRYSREKDPYHDNIKVMFTTMGLYTPFLNEGGLGQTETCMSLIVEDVNEGRNLLSYMNSEPIRYIAETAKWAGTLSGKVFKFLPEMPENRYWTNEELYNLWDITEDEQAIIKAHRCNANPKSYS